ncbi:MAG: hypothetical protein JAZ15_21950 [Candidatus Thiodiazotropha endolucinida]|nr:hypothetical protein [Candidatus Thiodiazotropha taylori]MCW4315681.1 hypothetical protein [Candidatus Thiodiazotropha taylori]
MIRTITLIITAMLVIGCTQQTYLTRPDPVTGINVYTTDGDKIQGTWAYIIDDSIKTASRTIKASSHACSLHLYPVNAGESLSSSASNALNIIFENTLARNSIPSINTAIKENITGAVIIKLDEFYPKFNCSIGQVEGYCNANTDISITVTLIDYPSGKRKYIHTNSQRSADGGSGQMCAGVSNVISESVKKASKDVLERMGEKISIVRMSF